MTCGPGPPCWTTGCSEARGALPWGGCTLPAWRFDFSTAGFGEDEGAFNRGAVACSFVRRFTFMTAGCPENEGRITVGQLHAPCVVVRLPRASGQSV
jgi:hypothetical protein